MAGINNSGNRAGHRFLWSRALEGAFSVKSIWFSFSVEGCKMSSAAKSVIQLLITHDSFKKSSSFLFCCFLSNNQLLITSAVRRLKILF